jgi:hypothetical protein
MITEDRITPIDRMCTVWTSGMSHKVRRIASENGKPFTQMMSSVRLSAAPHGIDARPPRVSGFTLALTMILRQWAWRPRRVGQRRRTRER